MKRAQEIEEAFKELHKGIYTWGESKLKIASEKGYVESVGGFKLYVPEYDKFKELEKWYDTLDNKFWTFYNKGKAYSQEYHALEAKKNKSQKDLDRLQELKRIRTTDNYRSFSKARSKISKFAKLRSEYFKLCLNNPAQSGAAFQTKAALIALFKTIVKRGDMWKARISNSPYDEILMEVKEDLAKDYKSIMEKCMIEEGNKWLKSDLFSMEADAVIGNSWHDCHGAKS